MPCVRPLPAGPSGWAGLLADGPFLALTAITSVFCSALAFWLMNAYQPEVSPVQAASIYTLEPVFATLWAIWLPGVLSPMIGLEYPSERPDLMLVLGGSLIVMGNVVGLGPLMAFRRAAKCRPGRAGFLNARRLERVVHRFRSTTLDAGPGRR